MGLCRYPFAKKHQAASPNTKPPELSLHLQLLDNQHPCSPSLPADCCSGSYSLYPTQTYETCHSDFKGAFRSPFCSGDTFLAKHITLIEFAVKQEGLQTMEGLYTVQHGWWADHQVTWCKSYKISQRHKLKAQSLVLQRDVWFVEVWWGVFFGIYFGTNLGIGLPWVSKPSFSSTCTFPQTLQCFLVFSGAFFSRTYSSFISLLETNHGPRSASLIEPWRYFKHTMSETYLVRNSMLLTNSSHHRTEKALLCTVHAVAEPQKE